MAADKIRPLREAFLHAVEEKVELPPPRSIWTRTAANLRNRIITGLLFLLPIIVTVWCVHFFLNTIYVRLEPGLRPLLEDRLGLDRTGVAYAAVGVILSVSVVLMALYFIGLVTARTAVKRVINLMEYVVVRIPLVKAFYKTTKQIVDTVQMSSSASLKKVVVIEYPRPGIWTVAFVTGRTRVEGRRREAVNVYVPTTPNPTSGYMVMLSPDEVYETNMSIEEAMGFIISAGILSPELMTLTPLAASQTDETEGGKSDEQKSTKDEGQTAEGEVRNMSHSP